MIIVNFFLRVRSLLVPFFLVALCSFSYLAAQYSDRYNSIIAIDTLQEKGEIYTSEPGTPASFAKDEELRKRFQKEIELVNADTTLNEQDKKYLATLAGYLAAKVLHLPKSTEEMKEKYCDEMEVLLDSFEEDIEKWEKDKAQKANIRSDGYRLVGDLNIFYANRCIGPFFRRMPRLVGSVKSYKKAMELDPNNMWAHISYGTYKHNAPKIGGGSVKEAIEEFSLAAEKGNELERYFAYCWLAMAYAKDAGKDEAKKQKAFDAIAQAKKIYPKGGMVRHFNELLEAGNYTP